MRQPSPSLVGVPGRRAAAGQADARRRQDLARQPRRQETGEPAGAGAQGHGPAHAAVDAGDRFFQPHHVRQRQLVAADCARGQHAQPAAFVDQRLLLRAQPALRVSAWAACSAITAASCSDKVRRDGHRALVESNLEKQKAASMKRPFCILAPRPGLEPGTCGLTVRRSTN
jgi:hypothetical protein